MGCINGFAARHGMGPVVVATLVVLTVAAALAGSAVDAVAPAVAIAVLLGLAGVWVVTSVVASRARALAAQVDVAAGDATQARRVFDDREEWRELGEAIDRVITSLQRRSDQLVEERVRSNELLEELPSAVLLFSADDLVYANRAARVMFAMPSGTDRGALTAPVAPALFADQGAKALLTAVDEVREVGRPVDVEIERGDLVLAARATRLGSGEVVLVIRDVTRARRLAEVRRDFVINASHELKTPVAGIQALAESLALALRHDPPRADRMVTRIEQEAGRLAHLVRDLLDLARLEEATGPPERRRVDLVTVVNRQIDRLSALAGTHGITITTQMPPSTVVVATPGDIRSIVANLLENAVRYNRHGGSVTVHVARVGGRVVLEVSDTGEGIAPGEQERIFERFYRIDKARSRAAGGTGLGLALVRHATQRLGGTVDLDSEVGAGSTFRVELPVAGD